MKAIFRLVATNFLGDSPAWYKTFIISFLILNPLVYFFGDAIFGGEGYGPFVAGWMVLIEFIFTLACALKCYPLQPGGLLAIESLLIGLTCPNTVFKEVSDNIPTLLLLIFMIAAIYFLKDVLSIAMTRLLLAIRRKYILCLVFCVICTFLAAFLSPFTIVAVAVAVSFNFYAIYYRVEGHSSPKELSEFRGFLRNFIMHGTAGCIIGGAMTLVGEPQNLMIGTKMGWSFKEFIVHCGPVSIPAAIAGFTVCFCLEYFKCPGYHYQLSEKARGLIQKDYKKKINELTMQSLYAYTVQFIVLVLLILALAFNVATAGLVGIGLIVIVTAFTGLTKEHDLGGAFTNAMPFVALIVVFFAILGVVHEQHLITPLAQWVFTFSGKMQFVALFFTNGTLSAVSDNVFIAAIFISEVQNTFDAGGMTQEWYEKLGVVVNMGTNIPAMATPNGHAALLFLLTSALAPQLHLSYLRMLLLALPYTIAMTITGALAIYFFL
jgi:NhaB family Na+:H+ antiporter